MSNFRTIFNFYLVILFTVLIGQVNSSIKPKYKIVLK